MHRQITRRQEITGEDVKTPSDGKSRSQSTRHFPTDMSPDDYMEILDRTDLRENEKLPSSIMSHWKIVNDQTNFSRRVNQGEAVHGNNPSIKFMKQKFLQICELRPKGTHADSSQRQASESIEMVPELTWTDVSVDNEINKAMQSLQIHATGFCKQQPTNLGNTDAEDNIKKLNKLADMPEEFSFSYQSNNHFMTEEQLQEQITLGNVDAERDVAEVDLEDNQHTGIFTGAKRFAKTQVHCCGLCGFLAPQTHTFLRGKLLWNSGGQTAVKQK